MLFFLVFVYVGIFLKPFHPPAFLFSASQIRSQALSRLCQSCSVGRAGVSPDLAFGLLLLLLPALLWLLGPGPP